MLVLRLLLIEAGVVPLYLVWMRLGALRQGRAAGELPAGEELGPDQDQGPGQGQDPDSGPARRVGPLALAAICLLLLAARGVVVVPEGMAGVVESRIRGTQPGTLRPGAHLVTPFVDRVRIVDLADHLFTTGMASGDSGTAGELGIRSRDGRRMSLGVTVRYRLDPARATPAGGKPELPAVVAGAWRGLASGYTAREILSARREELRARAAGTIASELEGDGIVVEEVLLTEIRLPEGSVPGLDALLAREQEEDRLRVLTDGNTRQVTIEIEPEGAGTAGAPQSAAAPAARPVSPSDGRPSVRRLASWSPAGRESSSRSGKEPSRPTRGLRRRAPLRTI